MNRGRLQVQLPVDNNLHLTVRLKRQKQESHLSMFLVLYLCFLTINSNQVQARSLCSLCNDNSNNNNDGIMALSDYSLPDQYRYKTLYSSDSDATVTCEEFVNATLRGQQQHAGKLQVLVSSEFCTILLESGFYDICTDCDKEQQQLLSKQDRLLTTDDDLVVSLPSGTKNSKIKEIIDFFFCSHVSMFIFQNDIVMQFFAVAIFHNTLFKVVHQLTHSHLLTNI